MRGAPPGLRASGFLQITRFRLYVFVQKRSCAFGRFAQSTRCVVATLDVCSASRRREAVGRSRNLPSADKRARRNSLQPPGLRPGITRNTRGFSNERPTDWTPPSTLSHMRGSCHVASPLSAHSRETADHRGRSSLSQVRSARSLRGRGPRRLGQRPLLRDDLRSWLLGTLTSSLCANGVKSDFA